MINGRIILHKGWPTFLISGPILIFIPSRRSEQRSTIQTNQNAKLSINFRSFWIAHFIALWIWHETLEHTSYLLAVQHSWTWRQTQYICSIGMCEQIEFIKNLNVAGQIQRRHGPDAECGLQLPMAASLLTVSLLNALT